MEIRLLCVGKNNRSDWFESMNDYVKRVQYYTPFSIDYISDAKTGKKADPNLIKKEETKKIISKINKDDLVILLDEKGKSFSSEGFAKEIENYQTQGVRSLVFLVGGAYGFSDEIYRTFPKKMRLSDLTFSHQMVRLFFCEQLYRDFTILNNHPYHNS